MLEDCCAAATDELHRKELEIINMIYCHVMGSQDFAALLPRAEQAEQGGDTMAHSVAGRSVVVTGGSRGIGKGIARVFAEAGAKVAILSRHGDEARRRRQGARPRRDRGRRRRHRRGQLAAAFAEVAASLRRHRRALRQCRHLPAGQDRGDDRRAWDLVIDTNLKGTFLSVKAALPWLKKSGQGRIVITSSITGPVTGYPGWTHYGATKAGQLGFMRTACIELAKYGITVNAVMPGNIKTEGLADLGDDYEATMAASIPLKRLGTVEDIGHAALYFASKEAGYVTGQTLIVDGGQILPESLEALASA